jgi:hypothetical protein
VGSRAVAVVAFTLLVAFFIVDALTPQTLVIAILFDIPIVLAALTRSRRLTAALVVTALGADLVAAIVNAARDGYRWDPIGIGDRLLSMLSILMVGYLSTACRSARSVWAGWPPKTRAPGARPRWPPRPTGSAPRFRSTW